MGNIDVRQPFEGLRQYDIDEIFANIHTPAYVIDEAMLHKNGSILKELQLRTGCKVLLAQKAFSNFNTYGILSQYIAGTEASGLFEARLGAEKMPEGEVHVFSCAYREDEFEEILKYADHIVFNSPYQLSNYGERAKAAGKSIGLRINPEYSTQKGHEIYDPCAAGSRLGTTIAQWDRDMTDYLISLLDGIHFHTLCEQDALPLAETLKAVEDKFGKYLYDLKWINFGGGHHITKDGYDIDLLEKCIADISIKYDVEVYLEPGEAHALNAGYMVTEVLDITKNGNVTNVIMDASAACHMPDVIEMPYMPPLYNASLEKTEENNITYRLGGPTCLAGDVVGDYYFDKKINIGDKLVFGDMAIYTTCKNNTFNGMPLPSIYILKRDEHKIEEVVSFGYDDFKNRLGK